MLSRYLSFFMVFSLGSAMAQQVDTIRLFNSSFEDTPQHSIPPRGWSDCGFPGETPPDVHPTTQFNVLRPAYSGRTYLGMVTRDNDTWEAVQQRLPSPIVGNQCYSFSIYLCRSDTYTSATRSNPNDLASFTEPVKLRVWGSSGYCEKKELLGESAPVKNIQWERYDFKFEPGRSHNFIILEAFYKTPILFPYNGNLLLDGATEIVLVPCDEEKQIASVEMAEIARKPDTRVYNSPRNNEATKATSSKEVTIKKPEKKFLNLNRDKMSKGSTFSIDNLYFEADSTNVPEACYPTLNELYDFMTENKDIIIEIGGHTNSIPMDEYCNKLSLARAKSVSAYLIGRGIESRRVMYRGYGKTKPIADDSTPEGKRKNQRVEIRVLYINKNK